MSLLLGCAGARHEAPPPAPVTIARTGTAPPVTVVPTPPPVRGPAESLLVAMFGKGRAAILIADEAPMVTGRSTVLEREPILSIVRSIPPEKLDAKARAKIEERYTVGTPSGKSCLATREDVAVMSRIVADDPTAGHDENETDADYVAKMFGRGERGAVVIVKLGAGCDDAFFAVPEGAPLPTVLAKTTAPPNAALERAAKAHDSDLAKAKLSFTSVAFGATFVWMRIEGHDGFTPGPCFAMKRAGAKVDVVASVFGCPYAPFAATESADGQMTLWFEHSRTKLVGTDLEQEFFPVASYAPAGGI